MDKYYRIDVVEAEKAKYEDTPAGKANPKPELNGVEGYNVKIHDKHYAFALNDFENLWYKNGKLPFGIALEALKTGKKIAREDWEDEYLIFSNGCIVYFLRNISNPLFDLSTEDILANDWRVLD